MHHGVLRDVRQERLGEDGGNHVRSVGDRSHRPHEIRDCRVLHDESLRPGLDVSDDLFRRWQQIHHDHTRGGRALADLLHTATSVAAAQSRVHEHNVGCDLRHFAERGGEVGDGPNDL